MWATMSYKRQPSCICNNSKMHPNHNFVSHACSYKQMSSHKFMQVLYIILFIAKSNRQILFIYLKIQFIQVACLSAVYMECESVLLLNVCILIREMVLKVYPWLL